MRLVYCADDDSYYGEHTRLSRAAFEAAVARRVAEGSEEQLEQKRLLDELHWLASPRGVVLR
jgi:hypothetical protein